MFGSGLETRAKARGSAAGQGTAAPHFRVAFGKVSARSRRSSPAFAFHSPCIQLSPLFHSIYCAV